MVTLVALSLFAHIDASHFAGALADPADLSDVPVSALTQEQLLSEQKRLEEYRTGFIGPVVMTAAGGGAVIIGVIFMALGVFYAFLPSLFGGGTTGGLSAFVYVGYALIGVASVAILVGGIFLTIGLIKLFPALAKRREASERRDEIQKRLEQMDSPSVPPPPPMPPGVDVLWRGPDATLLLTTF